MLHDLRWAARLLATVASPLLLAACASMPSLGTGGIGTAAAPAVASAPGPVVAAKPDMPAKATLATITTETMIAKAEPYPDALIAPGHRIALPHPSELGRAVEARQLVTMTHGSNTVSFESHISVNASRLRMVCIDMLGRRAMTVEWDGQKMKADVADWVPSTIRPGSMLADLMMIYWPEKPARAAVAAAGGFVRISGQKRVVRIDGEEILRSEVDWPAGAAWNGNVRFANLAWGYEASVQSVEAKPAPAKPQAAKLTAKKPAGVPE
jgi:hypothetical protein